MTGNIKHRSKIKYSDLLECFFCIYYDKNVEKYVIERKETYSEAETFLKELNLDSEEKNETLFWYNK